jgi:hypothetical protein
VRARSFVHLALAVVIAGVLLAVAALAWAFAPGVAFDKLVLH